MSEADEHFLERLRLEVEPVVARWARLTELRLDRHPEGVRIIAALETRTGPAEVVSIGETLIDAAAAVPVRLGETRLELALRELVTARGS